jgi:hypothetical protein
MPPHLLRCQGLAVDDYSFALGRLEAGATSTFAQLGSNSPAFPGQDIPEDCSLIPQKGIPFFLGTFFSKGFSSNGI